MAHPAAIILRVELDSALAALLLARFERIERALTHLGVDMSELDDKLTTLETDYDALEADEQRELADLQALKDAGQTLTPDQESRLDALDAKFKADQAAIDAVDAPPAPADGGETSDESGDTPAP